MEELRSFRGDRFSPNSTAYLHRNPYTDGYLDDYHHEYPYAAAYHHTYSNPDTYPDGYPDAFTHQHACANGYLLGYPESGGVV